jgi:hypothetical protein
MANATALTLTDLSGLTAVAQPTADVLDTGTAAVTLPLAVGGVTDRIMLEIKNTAAAALKVELLAGDNPPALRAGIGDAVLVAAQAQNVVNLFGPFESSRFIQNDATSKGRLDVKFTPASGTIGVQVRAYRLPVA